MTIRSHPICDSDMQSSSRPTCGSATWPPSSATPRPSADGAQYPHAVDGFDALAIPADGKRRILGDNWSLAKRAAR